VDTQFHRKARMLLIRTPRSVDARTRRARYTSAPAHEIPRLITPHDLGDRIRESGSLAARRSRGRPAYAHRCDDRDRDQARPVHDRDGQRSRDRVRRAPCLRRLDCARPAPPELSSRVALLSSRTATSRSPMLRLSISNAVDRSPGSTSSSVEARAFSGTLDQRRRPTSQRSRLWACIQRRAARSRRRCRSHKQDRARRPVRVRHGLLGIVISASDVR
jgi:hypothetical protein